ncbi:MAG: tRNA (adenosine(37)-N6)-threonylcarbamoyltransferase complex dimerization subunit type 1 TsaB [Planctomycetes bacterium]|nr:tRNA (adenosine(37)-N6)-threonylcarbamoyltransferase complex dimerization subunit type 1 TsaB [Planctomycetota bacterium]MBI9021265.1 tRNA (adenosine(37)-N6)-threonylcarbamoyltransferase complex dimerization subunit type 1 TsaB [Verrucomicrobiota bacterium]
MITLGIECSSRQGSVALLKNGELLAEKSWIAERVRHNTIFQTLENLIEEAQLSHGDISLYAIGRGPGSFSGMRMSFAIAQALALPSRAEVRAVSSGAALALAAAREGAQEIAVVGDARRGQVWIGFFQTLEKGGLKVSKPWKLVNYDEVSVPEGTLVVSPEAERLTTIFPNLGNPRFPLASDVAKLALMQTCPEPLEPLYMHPPVFIEPKYA